MLTNYSLLLSGVEFEHIRNAAEAGRSVHAYIIQGTRGMGKRSLALLLAAALVCPSSTPPCLSCNGCKRVLSGEHPDVHVFTSAKRSISVDEMRRLSERSLESSYEGGKRVFIINDAHTMTVQAQNCLLKTLEEPSGSAVFILLCASDGLLSTIRSRCRTIRMNERSVADISAQLVKLGYSSDDALSAARVAGGNIGRAIAIVKGEMGAVQSAQKLLNAVNGGSLPQAVSILASCKDNVTQVLENLQSLLELELQAHPEDLKALVRIKSVDEALARIKSNINYGLLTDKLARSLITGETVWQR